MAKIENGAMFDENIIVEMQYDKGGRMVSMRDPRGNLTEYVYDQLGRRTQLTNPEGHIWQTNYRNLPSGGSEVAMIYPGLTSATGQEYEVVREMDRLGRPAQVSYYSDTSQQVDIPAEWTTNWVKYVYNTTGNRTHVEEYNQVDANGTLDMVNPSRVTGYSHDKANRVTSMTVDTDADGTPEQTVSYTYDERGQRTTLSIDGMHVTYEYDARGRLERLTDRAVDGDIVRHQADFAYDGAGRHHTTARRSADGGTDEVQSTYSYDTAGRLTNLLHQEVSDAMNPVRQAEFAYTSFDGRGNRTAVTETLRGTDGTESSRTVNYAYDALSRLTQADDTTNTTVYDYTYDVAGNRKSEAVNGGTPTTFDYNNLNQLTDVDGMPTYNYDLNGNLISDGTNTYVWDRANRMLEAPGGMSYAYDGNGNRVQQTLNGTDTDFLLDTQGGLARVIAATTGMDTTHYLHGPRGIHAQYNPLIGGTPPATWGTSVWGQFNWGEVGSAPTGGWQHMLQDGLGSVRSMVNGNGMTVLGTAQYQPYGTPDTGSNLPTDFGFTGEWTDPNDLLYLRARYYAPGTGVFTALDPFEGSASRPMSLNGYSWVEGNVVNMVDPSGELADPNAPVAVNSDYDTPLQSSNRSLVPAQARTRFIEFESYVSQRLGRVNTCPDDPSPYKLSYRDIITLFVGGEFGSLANSLKVDGVRVGLEAVARYYYDYAGSDGLFNGMELWQLLGNVHSFYDETSNDVLYERMINSSYRSLATQILSGAIDGQVVTNGQAGGRPWNWGNNELISPRARRRLQLANTGSLNYSIYYRQENEYDYNVVAYFPAGGSPSGQEFVLWTLSQEYCFKSDSNESGAPLTGCAVYESREVRENGGKFIALPIDNSLTGTE